MAAPPAMQRSAVLPRCFLEATRKQFEHLKQNGPLGGPKRLFPRDSQNKHKFLQCS